MDAKQEARRKLFKAALILEGMTQQEWAAQHGGVSQGHLSMWMRGIRESGALEQKVDAYVKTANTKGAGRYKAFFRDYRKAVA